MSIIDSEHVLKPRIEKFKQVFESKKKKLANLEITLWDLLSKVEITKKEDELPSQNPIIEKENKL